MSHPHSNLYDVVIIGAGHAGLRCAPFLHNKRIGVIGSSPEAVEEAVILRRSLPK